MSIRRSFSTLSEQQIVDAFVQMYSLGAFPMAEPLSVRQRGRGRGTARPAIHWYSPDPRAVLPLEDGALRVWGGLRRAERRRRFVFTADHCFRRVIESCAEPGPRRGGPGETWLCDELVECYTLLHSRGKAHSLEAWLPATPDASTGGSFVATPPEGATLIGGIYGVCLGAAFFAESMFSRPEQGGSDSSSLCLVHLWCHLRRCGYELLDVQIANHHTLQFGVKPIAGDEYLRRLAIAIAKPDAWTAPAVGVVATPVEKVASLPAVPQPAPRT